MFKHLDYWMYFIIGWFGGLFVLSAPFTLFPTDSPDLNPPRLFAVAIGVHVLAIASGVWLARRQTRLPGKGGSA